MLIKIDQDKILWWLMPGLLTVEITILMLDALVTELGWIPIGAARRFFNITREDGIPNFLLQLPDAERWRDPKPTL